jgi:hypothetical protein
MGARGAPRSSLKARSPSGASRRHVALRSRALHEDGLHLGSAHPFLFACLLGAGLKMLSALTIATKTGPHMQLSGGMITAAAASLPVFCLGYLYQSPRVSPKYHHAARG